MKRPAILQAASPIEGLLITLMANRRRLLWVPAIIFAGSLSAAVVLPVRYAVEAQVLVALGPEYTYRALAGEPPSASQGMDRDATMHTEASILASADLHRDTLRKVGVERLYPHLLHPGSLGRVIKDLRDSVTATARWAGLLSAKPKAPRDPVELALKTFESALGSDVPKIGSVITATFHHQDPVLGAETLNTMLGLYIERRAALYRDEQSTIVASQVDATKQAWAATESRLARFMLDQGVSGFAAQRDILLHREGALRGDQADAESTIAQLQARLQELGRQAATVPQNVASGNEADFETRLAPTRASLEQMQAEYTRALEQYQPDAPLVRSLRARLDARQADLAEARRDRSVTTVRTSQNPAWLSLKADQLTSRTSLAATSARLDQDTQHLAAVTANITRLDASEQELGQLQLQRALAEDTYRNATKMLEDRRVADEVEARRRPTVRILQPARPPISAPPTRILLVGAGAILAVLGLVGATLLTHAFARTYWQTEALEQDFGIAVLATFPELPSRQDTGDPTALQLAPAS